MSLAKSSQPSILHISTTSSLFNLLAGLALYLSSLDHHHRPSGSPHLVSGMNSLLLSVNLIPVFLSYLTRLFLLLPHLLRLLTRLPLSPSVSPSLFQSRLKTCLFHKSFPLIASLPVSELTAPTL